MFIAFTQISTLRNNFHHSQHIHIRYACSQPNITIRRYVHVCVYELKIIDTMLCLVRCWVYSVRCRNVRICDVTLESFRGPTEAFRAISTLHSIFYSIRPYNRKYLTQTHTHICSIMSCIYLHL